MTQYRRKKGRNNRRNKEASIISELLRILFAVSMLSVAILAAFFVMKNLSGFSLPELKQTLPEVQIAEESVTEKKESSSRLAETTGSGKDETELSKDAIVTTEAYSLSESSTEHSTQDISYEAETSKAVRNTEKYIEAEDDPPETAADKTAHNTEAVGYEAPVIDDDGPVYSPGPAEHIEINNHGSLGPGQE